ncbi:hypothetical protein RN346_01750 [Halomonas sp. PAMB 3232]|uniref:hypothetical protein n=1 Tax=Halomonas sp. PAMB 3232 TaxID=3075221 RepID=UPI0028977240|nr:hypothetical protein [Halomonas sp. PAMB 3232]WNL39303.1 hypothetical protein RN346_01750 [Halomonas sp. PAMB 3232]
MSIDYSPLRRHANKRTNRQARKKAYAEQKDIEGPSPKTVRRHAHRITSCALWFAAILIAIIISVRFWHLVGFREINGVALRWLSNEDLQSIDKMLFSSAFGGAALAYIKHVMLEGAEQDAREKRAKEDSEN